MLITFKKLEKANLKVNVYNCSFAKEFFVFVYQIIKYRIQPNEKKVVLVNLMKTPTKIIKKKGFRHYKLL